MSRPRAASRKAMKARGAGLALALLLATGATAARADVSLPVPKSQRSDIQYERSGQHDANNIRTIFYNFGMVGDYPPNPGSVDLSVFHSVEVPKGTGMDYSDGITPFVLCKLNNVAEYPYIMETGYRERQAFNALNQQIRFEPRPGYFQPDPNINKGRSVAMSHDPRTWPAKWPDKLDDPTDPGWPGSWDGYFGKRPAADQESYTVMDDDMYDGWFDFNPDSTDPSRRGLGLRVEVRGFQWANPQSGNVIFWHYDITNEGTTDYDNNIIFGLYMDSGVGGSAYSCDKLFESDDDNAYFDKSFGLNLVYTWDNYGHGVDLTSTCAPTGYLGYAYLETPGNPFDGIDNDNDGITDESRDSGPGIQITGRDSIRAYVNAHYDMTKFQAYYGPLENRPAYRAGVWWTGDEDMDWTADFDDVGADGVPNTHDFGEGDGIPTSGEPNFDKTDVDESDQIGLTGFRMNRIGPVGTSQPLDRIVFFDLSGWEGPQELYQKFTSGNVAARFDSSVALNYNIAFFFASGPFQLRSHLRERFSLALGYGADLFGLRETVHAVQRIYNANYQFAVPPTMPTLTAEAGDGLVRLTWDNAAELSPDPVTNVFDFEGYKVYRSTDPDFLDTRTLTDDRGNPLSQNGKALAQFDLKDGVGGNSHLTVDGVAFYLGSDTGIQHYYVDSTAVNGQLYYYAVTAYDFGSPAGVPDSLAFFPSENAIAVSRTPRGGIILPRNVVALRAEPVTGGWTPASVTSQPAPFTGSGTGAAQVVVKNSSQVPDGHVFKIGFAVPSLDSIRTIGYSMIDSTTHTILFKSGIDLDGQGVGPVGAGLLPIIQTPVIPALDTLNTKLTASSRTNVKLATAWEPPLDRNLKRPGYPENITVTFDSTFIDTSTATGSFSYRFPKPAKFKIIAHGPNGDHRLRFRFLDRDNDGTLDQAGESFDIMTDASGVVGLDSLITWRVSFAGIDSSRSTTLRKTTRGDVYNIAVTHPYTLGDTLVFRTAGQYLNPTAEPWAWQQKPYVVPNPYLGSASFEPSRFATSGRGDRRIEFRAIPIGGVVRIYTVHGDLVQTLRQDGSYSGYVPWDLRTKDNLDVAPGLYIFHVEAPGLGSYVGKFAVIK